MTGDLERAGRQLRRARASIERALEQAQSEALKAIAAGEPESAVARALGVDRMTVRKWQGKR